MFAINGALADAKRALNPHTFVSPHGVDHALFARALDRRGRCPGRTSRRCRGPRIGFYGTLRDWVDLELVAAVARARPPWSIVLIGQQLGDLSPVRGHRRTSTCSGRSGTTSSPRTARASTSA